MPSSSPKKILSQSPDPELVVLLELDRPEALFCAGESIVGRVKYQAVHAFNCDTMAVTLTCMEKVRGTNRKPFKWVTTTLETTKSIDAATGVLMKAGEDAISFDLPLDATLGPSFTIDSPSIGVHMHVTATRSYKLSATVNLRNSTKITTAIPVLIRRSPDLVWPQSVHSASIEATMTHCVASPFSILCCRRRAGETTILATLHNRVVDIESGIVHVRVLVANRSPLAVTAVRLCLMVDMALHEKEAEQEEQSDAEPTHTIDLLYASDHDGPAIACGVSSHLNLAMNLKQVASAQITDHETELLPTMRSRYLEIQYAVRVEVCHANGGPTVWLDMPLILVPQPSDVMPTLENHELIPIEGGESQRSTEHDEGGSRVSSRATIPAPRGSRTAEDLQVVQVRISDDREKQ